MSKDLIENIESAPVTAGDLASPCEDVGELKPVALDDPDQLTFFEITGSPKR